MSHEESNHREQLLLFPTQDSITLREIADGGMLVFGEVCSGKASSVGSLLEHLIELHHLPERDGGDDAQSSDSCNAFWQQAFEQLIHEANKLMQLADEEA